MRECIVSARHPYLHRPAGKWSTVSIDSRVRVGALALLVDDGDINVLRLFDHAIVSYMHLVTWNVIFLSFSESVIPFSLLTRSFCSCVKLVHLTGQHSASGQVSVKLKALHAGRSQLGVVNS